MSTQVNAEFEKNTGVKSEWEKGNDVVSEIKENVNHPNHYQGKHECIDVMIEMFGIEAVINFCKCNIFKYRFRSNKKNGEEDIKKAEWYEEKLIELNHRIKNCREVPIYTRRDELENEEDKYKKLKDMIHRGCGNWQISNELGFTVPMVSELRRSFKSE